MYVRQHLRQIEILQGDTMDLSTWVFDYVLQNYFIRFLIYRFIIFYLFSYSFAFEFKGALNMQDEDQMIVVNFLFEYIIYLA